MATEEFESSMDLISYPITQGWEQALTDRLNLTIGTLDKANVTGDEEERTLQFERGKSKLSLEALLAKFRKDFGVEIRAIPMDLTTSALMHNTGIALSEIPPDNGEQVLMFQLVAIVGEVVLSERVEEE